MIFRTSDGKLIEIKKSNYLNDSLYYKKIISIWGNTVPQFGMTPYRTHPASQQFEVTGLKCRPCSKIGYQKCPKKHFNCMLKQDLEGIVRAAHQLFSSTER